ncbi:SpoIIIAH-like family protein [Paenibacillus sp. S-38]|uniref:SpoIIIAH-like family protein n=1 Tax=Paenibacillus sp. S-38 TaxID=3416710 RepID=UPI003CF55F39
MNTKRQTVWLVSMLSLMVVLSAYYLFTEDVNQIDVKTAGAPTKELTVNTGQMDGLHPAAAPDAAAKSGAAPAEGAKPDAKAADPKASDAKAADPKASDAKAADPKASDAKAAQPQAAEQKADPQAEAGKATEGGGEHKESSTKTDKPSSAAPDAAGTPASKPVSGTESSLSAEDAQVLKTMQTGALNGAGYFQDLQMVREAEISKKSEQLVSLIADTKQTTEAAANAQAELHKLQDMEAKIEYLEGLLTQTYAQAVVTQEGAKWKVTVQTDKLDRNQAFSITDQAMKELGIAKENISVSFKP